MRVKLEEEFYKVKQRFKKNIVDIENEFQFIEIQRFSFEEQLVEFEEEVKRIEREIKEKLERKRNMFVV